MSTRMIYSLFIIRGDIWRVEQQHVDFFGQAGKKRVDQITLYRIQDCLNRDRYQFIEFVTVNGKDERYLQFLF